MEPAVFFVTALADVKKESFGAKLHELLEQQVPVRIIFANLNFAERGSFDRLLTALTAHTHQQVTVASLYDVFCDDQGIPLSTDTLLTVNHVNLKERRFTETDGQYYVRYFKDNDLVEESHYLADDRLFYQNFYQQNERVQVAFYDGHTQPEIISNFEDGHLKESLLLNRQGELVYRFVRETHPVQRLFNMTNTANLQLTNVATAQPAPAKGRKAQATQKNTLTVLEQQETDFKVMNYVDFDRFDHLYDFYRQVLQRVDFEHQRLYVNIDHNVEMSTVLPKQLIFNY